MTIRRALVQIAGGGEEGADCLIEFLKTITRSSKCTDFYPQIISKNQRFLLDTHTQHF